MGGFRSHVHIEWRGPQVAEELKGAVDNIIKDIAEDIISNAKTNVHKITGTLGRSIKADRPGNVQDRTGAATTRDLGHPVPNPHRGGTNQFGRKAVLVIGGTTFYAIYEELRHPYMWPAVAQSKARVNGHIRAHKI